MAWRTAREGTRQQWRAGCGTTPLRLTETRYVWWYAYRAGNHAKVGRLRSPNILAHVADKGNAVAVHC